VGDFVKYAVVAAPAAPAAAAADATAAKPAGGEDKGIAALK
jgi:hypothetical protein